MKIYSRKPQKCPCCKHTPLANVLYGSPNPSPSFFEDLDAGKITLGGCCVFADSAIPKWKCVKCETEFYQRKEVDEVNRFLGRNKIQWISALMPTESYTRSNGLFDSHAFYIDYKKELKKLTNDEIEAVIKEIEDTEPLLRCLPLCSQTDKSGSDKQLELRVKLNAAHELINKNMRLYSLNDCKSFDLVSLIAEGNQIKS
jgi:hypothetical protein